MRANVGRCNLRAMAEKQKLPDAIREQITRDKLSLAEVAQHHGLSENEFVNTYDLADVTFAETSGAEAQAEATNPPQSPPS